MSHFRNLTKTLAGNDDGRGTLPAGIIRLGRVDAVGSRNDGGSTYTVVTIDGLEMRCLTSYPSPTVGDVVVWLSDGRSEICAGPLTPGLAQRKEVAMAINVGGRACVLGFDWSSYQQPRSLRDAAAGGYRFGIIKATEGDAYRDTRYRDHVANVVDAGLVPGAYHFARPDWSDGTGYLDGRQEALFLLSVIDDRILFLILDMEATQLDAQGTADFIVGFWERIVESGRFPIREQRVTYVGKWFSYVHAARIRELSVLHVPSYTAHPQDNPDPARINLPAWSSDLWPEGWALWQFTDRGTVAGLHPSDVDVATEAWFDAVLSGTASNHHMDSQEDDMARPIYKFAAGIDNPNAHYDVIDWRDGAYPLPDGTGVGYGPHWYHTSDKDEIYQLVGSGRINVAFVNYLAAGNDGLDRAYEKQPHVYAGDTYKPSTDTAPAPSPPPTGPGAVDVAELVPRLAGPVATEIAQRSSRA